MISKEQIDEMIDTLESLGYVVVNANEVKKSVDKVEKAITEFKEKLLNTII